MARNRIRSLTGILALTIAATFSLGGCATPSVAQAQELRIHATARVMAVDMRRYQQVEPSVTVPFTDVSWHRTWLVAEPAFLHLLAGYWRWHLAGWRVFARKGDAETRHAENAYLSAISQWVGDQKSEFGIVRNCVGTNPYYKGPFNQYAGRCFREEVRRHQAMWAEGDIKLRAAASLLMRSGGSEDFPLLSRASG